MRSHPNLMHLIRKNRVIYIGNVHNGLYHKSNTMKLLDNINDDILMGHIMPLDNSSTESANALMPMGRLQQAVLTYKIVKSIYEGTDSEHPWRVWASQRLNNLTWMCYFGYAALQCFRHDRRAGLRQSDRQAVVHMRTFLWDVYMSSKEDSLVIGGVKMKRFTKNTPFPRTFPDGKDHFGSQNAKVWCKWYADNMVTSPHPYKDKRNMGYGRQQIPNGLVRYYLGLKQISDNQPF